MGAIAAGESVTLPAGMPPPPVVLMTSVVAARRHDGDCGHRCHGYQTGRKVGTHRFLDGIYNSINSTKSSLLFKRAGSRHEVVQGVLRFFVSLVEKRAQIQDQNPQSKTGDQNNLKYMVQKLYQVDCLSQIYSAVP